MPQLLASRNNASEITGTAADEIRSLHESIVGHARQSLDNAIRIGEILTQVKSVLKHGQWLDWLEKSVPFSQRTAYNYMTCFERREAFKVADITNLTKAYGQILSSNGAESREPQRLHESNFYVESVRYTQTLMGKINHEIKDRPIDSWSRDNWISLAAALEPLAELYGKLKSLIG